MGNTAITYLSDRNNELTQRNKRYESALKYLAKIAKEELEKDENVIEAEIIALEIVKVFEDTVNYKFSFDN